MTHRVRFVALAVALAAALTGCASGTAPGTASPLASDAAVPGDIPDSAAYVAVTAPANDFTVSIPEGWARSVKGDTIRYADNGRNTITLRSAAAPTAPTVQSARSGVIPLVARGQNGFRLDSVSSATRAGQPVIRVLYRVAAATNQVTRSRGTDAVELYLYWKAGRQAELTLRGAQGSDNVDPWRKVSDSLRWSGR